jgi:hypothetical protein
MSDKDETTGRDAGHADQDAYPPRRAWGNEWQWEQSNAQFHGANSASQHFRNTNLTRRLISEPRSVLLPVCPNSELSDTELLESESSSFSQ